MKEYYLGTKMISYFIIADSKQTSNARKFALSREQDKSLSFDWTEFERVFASGNIK